MAKKESVVVQQAIKQDLDNSVQVHEAIKADAQQKIVFSSSSQPYPFFSGIRSQTSPIGTIYQDEKVMLLGGNLLAGTTKDTVLKTFVVYESKGQLVCTKFNCFFPPSNDKYVILDQIYQLKKIDERFNVPITDTCITIPASIWKTALKDAVEDKDVKTVRFSLSYGNGNFVQASANIARRKYQ